MKKINLTLIVIILIQFLQLRGQDSPIALDLEKHVDKFTGDLNYSIPLNSLKGPNGESFPFVLNYRSSIGVDQEASWVGLGWDLDIGEIVRNVNGYPDDWLGGSVVKFMDGKEDGQVFHNKIIEKVYGYGPIYFKDFPLRTGLIYDDCHIDEHRMDVMTSRENVKSDSDPSFYYPDYDNFYASAPGFGGEFKAYLFDYASLFVNEKGGSQLYPGFQRFTKSAQFRFLGEGLSKVEVPYYNETTYLLLESGKHGSNYSWPNNSNLFDLCVKDPQQIGIKDYTGDYNPARSDEKQRVSGGRVIEYFTNQEIRNHFYSSNTSDYIEGFLELEIPIILGENEPDYSIRGKAVSNVPNGIGAYRITDVDGMVYHYSLPVYTSAYQIQEFEVNSVGAPLTEQTEYCDDVPVESYKTLIHSQSPYANSWKLTAITGPDYIDVNQNSFPDEGDLGYWISIKYGKWTKDNSQHIERIPYYGYNFSKGYKKFWNHSKTKLFRDEGELINRASITNEVNELYYPNYIKTATQTAFLIKDIRNDAIGAPNPLNSSITPKLYLKEIIILDNEDVDNMNLFSNYSSTYPSHPFLGSYLNLDKVLKYTDYVADSARINQYILSSISFNTNYSLAKGVYNNFGYNHSSVVQMENNNVEIYSNPVLNYVSNNSVNDHLGKLTLNGITFYGYKRKKIHSKSQNVESFHFKYTRDPKSSNAFNQDDGNPNYDYRGKDYFGTYRNLMLSDARYPNSLSSFEGFLTDDNISFSDAWSLKSIQLPTQGVINIDYESDDYTRVGSNLGGTYTPSRFFKANIFQNESGSLKSLIMNRLDGYFTNNGSNVEEVKVLFSLKCAQKPGSLNYSTSKMGNLSLISNLSNEILELPNYNSYARACDPNGTDRSTTIINGSKALVIFKLKKAYGGGVRVKSISYLNPTITGEEEYFLDFKYKNGFVGREPGSFSTSSMKYYNNFHSYSSPALAQVDRFSPISSVGYDSVEVIPRRLSVNTNEVENTIGKKLYTFFNNSDWYGMSITQGKKLTYEQSSGAINRREYSYVMSFLKDIGKYGRPISTLVYDRNNNQLSKTTYRYSSGLSGSDYGSMEEVFYRFSGENVNSYSGAITFEGAFIKKERNVFLKEIAVEEGNVNTFQAFSDIDKLTGLTTSVLFSNNTASPWYRTLKLPAYNEYSSMGSKIDNPNNTNQLVVPSLVKTGVEKHTNANYIFSNTIKCRKFKTTAGEYEYVSQLNKKWVAVKSYQSNGETLPENWDLEMNFTLFDENHNILESKDGSDNYQANKIASSKLFVVAKGTMTNYASFFHTSFEYKEEDNYYDNEIYSSAGIANSQTDFQNSGIHSHTGSYVARIANGETLKYSVKRSTANVNDEVVEQGILPGRTYEASVWVHTSSPTNAVLEVIIDGISLSQTFSSSVSVTKSNSENLIIGDWALMKVNFEVPEDFTTPNSNHGITVSCKNTDSQLAYFDDFRLQPVDAEVEAFVYDYRRELPLFVLDNENFYSRFEYNPAGAVVRSYRETELGEKIILETTNQYPK